MVVIIVTGANIGCGYECCRQLSEVSEVTKIVISARSNDKAENTISKLVKDTGKDKSFFDYILLDLGDVNSIKTAVKEWPAFDRLCLNAGGIGSGKMHASGNGITDAMVINTIGNAMLVDGLFAAGKVPKGSRIVWVGSEVSRNILSFTGLLPQYCGNFKEKDIDWAIGKDYDGCCSCVPIRRQLGDYKNAKIVGHMHFAHLAKEHPDHYIISVSPGAVGGSFAERARCPVKQLMACAPCMFRMMCVTHACSPSTALRIGTKRYTEVLTGEPKFKSGTMPMSPKDCGLCFWGGHGTMIDNRPYVKYFRDEELCEKTANKVREWASKWESQAPVQVKMA